MTDYSNAGYAPVNSHLREGKEIDSADAEHQDIINTLDVLIDKSPGLSEDQIVFRGARLKPSVLVKIKDTLVPRSINR